MVCSFHVDELHNRKNLTEEPAFFNLKQKILGKLDPASLSTDTKWLLLLKYPVWYDPNRPRHKDCRCRPDLKPVRCANPNCSHRFKPDCCGELFCCLLCFVNSDFDRIALLIIRFRGNIKRARHYLSKLRYRATEKGRDSRGREYENRNVKRDLENREPVVAAPFKPHLEFDLDESVRAFLFGLDASQRQCKRIGCTNILDGEKVNGIEKSYCSTECRDAQRKWRRVMRSVKPGEKCPVAAYIETIVKIVRF